MRKLTEKQAQFLSQRFNASCTTPGVTDVTQMEMAVNDWLKELIAESAALHESVRAIGYTDDHLPDGIVVTRGAKVIPADDGADYFTSPRKAQPEPERGTELKKITDLLWAATADIRTPSRAYDRIKEAIGLLNALAPSPLPVREHNDDAIARILGDIVDRIDMAPNDDPLPYVRQHVMRHISAIAGEKDS